MSETGKESCSICWFNEFKEGIPDNFDGYEEDHPLCPCCRLLLACRSRGGFLADILSSHAQRKGSISYGSAAIEKDEGS